MTEGTEEGLNERAQLLLKALIENYIRDGQPVGSRTLSRDSGLSLSSATIRNVMADLEDLGFVASPHTSAGHLLKRPVWAELPNMLYNAYDRRYRGRAE